MQPRRLVSLFAQNLKQNPMHYDKAKRQARLQRYYEAKRMYHAKQEHEEREEREDFAQVWERFKQQVKQATTQNPK